MKKIILICTIIFTAQYAYSQIKYPVKVEGCSLRDYCFDCGDKKISYDAPKLNALLSESLKKNDFFLMQGQIMLQILVDSNGKSCVVSHTDKENRKSTKDIINILNNFKGWYPAYTDGIKENKVLLSFSVNLYNEKFTTAIIRYEHNTVMATVILNRGIFNIDSIYTEIDVTQKTNTKYNYTNDNLIKYKIKVWDSVSTSRYLNLKKVIVDKNNYAWILSSNGLLKFDGTNSKIVDFRLKDFLIDNKGLLWAVDDQGLVSMGMGSKKTYLEPDLASLTSVNSINQNNNEIEIYDNAGLIIYDGTDFTNILSKNKIYKQFKKTPVRYSFLDSQKRRWIGTDSLTFVLNADKIDISKTPLNNNIIISAAEIKNGDVYFIIEDKITAKKTLARLKKDGTWLHYSTSNSGLPSGSIRKLAYDNFNNILWISSDNSGLTRFDLNSNWENYTKENSQLPTSIIKDLYIDNKGVIYLLTLNNFLKLELQ